MGWSFFTLSALTAPLAVDYQRTKTILEESAFSLINNQLLLFPALLRVWYCLEGHDSLLAVCCMPEPTAGAGYLPVIGLRERRPCNPRILISRPHTYSCLGTGYCRHRADNRGVYDSLLWGGTSWNLLPTEHFTKERKDNNIISNFFIKIKFSAVLQEGIPIILKITKKKFIGFAQPYINIISKIFIKIK